MKETLFGDMVFLAQMQQGNSRSQPRIEEKKAGYLTQKPTQAQTAQHNQAAFPAVLVAKEVLYMSYGKHRVARNLRVTVAVAFLQAICPHIFRLIWNFPETQRMKPLEAVVITFSTLCMFYYGIFFWRLLHSASSAFLQRKHINGYIGALLDDESAAWYRLPYIEVQDARTCALNIMAWAQMRYILLRISNRNVKMYNSLLIFAFASDVVLLGICVNGLMIRKTVSPDLVIAAANAFAITVYILRVMQRAGEANFAQTTHYGRLTRAEFVMRQHQTFIDTEHHEQYVLACKVVHSCHAHFADNDVLVRLFGLLVDEQLLVKLMLFLMTAMCAVASQYVIASRH
eukprot:c2413_g1_i1.p1 GENE.c2413_g1_i1~~c2413_g1_i1.p1  ORF type:complete len:353 (+),score=77.79 c2413_g1_i1:32-1060(+)